MLLNRRALKGSRRRTGMEGKFLKRLSLRSLRQFQEFGWRQPIVVDKQGVVIVGHVRLLAAKKLTMTEVAVHVAESAGSSISSPGQRES